MSYSPKSTDQGQLYGILSPDLMLESIEASYGIKPQPSIEPFNSYVNRVYGFEGQDQRLIAKFYRPGRWSRQGLLDEHQFLLDCAEAEVPVVAPLPGLDGSTVQTITHPQGQIFMALFPRRAGRQFDAETPLDWERLGALAGRIHGIGKTRRHVDRPLCSPLEHASTMLQELWDGEVVHPDIEQDFFDLCDDTLHDIAPLFAVPFHRIHGDFHRGNILERGPEGLLAIDFDDTMMGPAVQDLWLLLPGRSFDCPRELDALLQGYTAFCDDPSQDFILIEALRFMRLIHYLAWLSKQRHDLDFTNRHPGWGSKAYWIKELEDLRTQAAFARGEQSYE